MCPLVGHFEDVGVCCRDHPGVMEARQRVREEGDKEETCAREHLPEACVASVLLANVSLHSSELPRVWTWRTPGR